MDVAAGIVTGLGALVLGLVLIRRHHLRRGRRFRLVIVLERERLEAADTDDDG